MAKVVQLHAVRPGGWAKDRWEWLRRVRRDATLRPSTRLVAQALATGYANAETAECRPGHAALAEDCGCSVRAVERAMLELAAAGWIERLAGNAPGRRAAIRFNLPEHPPKRADEHPPKRADETAEHPPKWADEHPPMRAETPAQVGDPPCTPYKDEPNLNHSARKAHAGTRGTAAGEPACVKVIVPFRSDCEAEWTAWLEAAGFDALPRIGVKGGGKGEAGWVMPFRRPPNPRDAMETGIARRWAEWLGKKSRIKSPPDCGGAA